VGIILDATLDHWRTGRGDNDILGWAITAAYLIGATLCARTALAALRRPADAHSPERPSDWTVLSAGLLLLGLNKQLDLQILMRDLGVAFVAFIGLDRHRKWVGRAFVLVLGLLLIRVLLLAAKRVRGHTRGHRVLLTGLALLACFAVVRAGTYVPGLKQFNLQYKDALHLVFELGGVLLVGLSAWRTRQRLVRHHSSSISSA
jgi:hypothetical protein